MNTQLQNLLNGIEKVCLSMAANRAKKKVELNLKRKRFRQFGWTLLTTFWDKIIVSSFVFKLFWSPIRPGKNQWVEILIIFVYS